MGWEVGYDENWKRDVGYGVPAICDHPLCNVKIDRGLSYVCGGEPFGGEEGCGLYFCGAHLLYLNGVCAQRCERCVAGTESFDPKPDVPEWITHKLNDVSWAGWREQYPKEVAALRSATA